ncbi:MAG: DUF3303 domain-containing protein [Promethearchaeota archaeon]
MLFMVIENFKKYGAKAVYNRYEKNGRMMPEGLNYINSWVDKKFEKCYQVVECDDTNKLQEWISNWQDLVDFEIIPVMTSNEAYEKYRRSEI